MSYVDGFVVPVPDGNKEADCASAQKMTAICKRLGAPVASVLMRDHAPEDIA